VPSARQQLQQLCDAAMTGCRTFTDYAQRLEAAGVALVPVTQLAQQHPYLVPVDGNCAAIIAEIHKLDEVLGADLDAPASDDTPSLLDRSGDFAEDQAVGAVQRTAEGLVPFRGWVRKLSGAERYSKKVSASITAGSVRRAFLKGVASQHCSSYPPLQTAAVPVQR
jgi:hypothetical protein